VVGYAALMERGEKATHKRLMAGRKELFGPEIARHQGRVFKLMGDDSERRGASKCNSHYYCERWACRACGK
jgi:class 3 adenylate cyclase